MYFFGVIGNWILKIVWLLEFGYWLFLVLHLT